MIRRWKLDTNGVAAVEFAMILPVMLLCYVGLVETTQFFAADRKAVLFARTLSDLAAQAPSDSTSGYPTMDDTNLGTVFALSSAVLYPFDANKAVMRVSSLAFDSTVPAMGGANNANTPTKAFVDWADTCTVQSNGSCSSSVRMDVFSSANTQCDIEMVPLGIAIKSGYSMRAEVSFRYKPILAGLLTPSDNSYQGLFSFMPAEGYQLSNTLYMRPRNNAFIVRKRNNGTSTLSVTNQPTTPTKCQPTFKP